MKDLIPQLHKWGTWGWARRGRWGNPRSLRSVLLSPFRSVLTPWRPEPPSSRATYPPPKDANCPLRLGPPNEPFQAPTPPLRTAHTVSTSAPGTIPLFLPRPLPWPPPPGTRQSIHPAWSRRRQAPNRKTLNPGGRRGGQEPAQSPIGLHSLWIAHQ